MQRAADAAAGDAAAALRREQATAAARVDELTAQLAAAHAELKSQRDFISNYQAQVAGVEEEARA